MNGGLIFERQVLRAVVRNNGVEKLDSERILFYMELFPEERGT